MQSNQHQLMGYDRAITMFSPDGRLLQVEYAKKTVKQGSTAIGVQCKDGVVLVTDKRIHDKLVVGDSVDKIFQIDDHVISTASGIIPDARVLVERAQTRAQQHNITFDSPIDVISIVKDLAGVMQWTTQSGGMRPFGVTILVAGVDKSGPRLYSTDPVGVYGQYLACGIGEKGDEAMEILREHYKESITLKEGMKLAIRVLKDVMGADLDADRVDCASVGENMKTVRLTKKEIKEILG